MSSKKTRLVLTRHLATHESDELQGISIGDEIKLFFKKAFGKNVRVMIEAPQDMEIKRVRKPNDRKYYED
jgi:sRNA-binding carbon storage regulator CsrA